MPRQIIVILPSFGIDTPIAFAAILVIFASRCHCHQELIRFPIFAIELSPGFSLVTASWPTLRYYRFQLLVIFAGCRHTRRFLLLSA